MEYNPPKYFPCPFLCKIADEITCKETIMHFFLITLCDLKIRLNLKAINLIVFKL